MRKTVHLCLSSHDEVMYRSEADLIMGFNCLALAVLETESRLLAEGFMTTHHHYLVQTDHYKELMFRSRYAYARYFNAKYSRKGQLGERQYFSQEIEGLFHTTAALNYVIRQGLHHGLTSTPFEYPHCSANAFFRKELGRHGETQLLRDSTRYQYLPKNKSLPADRYRMSAIGRTTQGERCSADNSGPRGVHARRGGTRWRGRAHPPGTGRGTGPGGDSLFLERCAKVGGCGGAGA